MNARTSEYLLTAQQRLQERYNNSHPFPNRRGWLYRNNDGMLRLRRLSPERVRQLQDCLMAEHIAD